MNRPAKITQADVARIVRGARKAGAAEVEVRLGEASVVIRLEKSTGAEEPETAGGIVL